MKVIKIFIFILIVDSVVSQQFDNAVDVKTTSGLVRGQSINVFNYRINQFLNIPYAEPPIGELRFTKPKPLQKPRDGIIDGTKLGNSCVQPIGLNQKNYNLKLSEDCLVLNIWSPKDVSQLKPVMFWIFGESLTIGSIFMYPDNNASVLSTYDVVLVSANYRLGPFGFLYGGEDSAPGNVGFFDQNLALKWVRKNIHLFGGDKNQITIVGQSGGSWSVSAHLLSLKSKGLFKRAIMQSGSILWNKDRPPVNKEEALNNAKHLAKSISCPDDNKWLKCLKRTDITSFLPLIQQMTALNFTFPTFGTEFLPFSTKTSLETNNFNKDLDILAGFTKDEGANLLMTNLTNGHPMGYLNMNTNREDFKNVVKFVNNFYHNIDIEKTIDFYLNYIHDSDSMAIIDRAIDFIGDITLKCPTYLFVKRYAQYSKPNSNFYFYELTYAHPPLGPFVVHGSDVPLVLGYLLNESLTKDERKFIIELQTYWTNFAKFGKPKNWHKFIPKFRRSVNKIHSMSKIKDLNPGNSEKYFNHLLDKTCDDFWAQYY